MLILAIHCSVVSLAMYVIFKNIRKNSFSLAEFVCIMLVVSAANIVTFLLIPVFALSAITFNVICIAILTALSYVKIKVFPLCAVYAVLSVIILLFSANLVGALLTLAHIVTQGHILIGLDAVINDVILSTIYLTMMFAIGFTISFITGHYLNKKTSGFDNTLKSKWATYALYGAIITLGVFFTLTFLRYVLTDSATLTLIYAIALAISFAYLIFATFAFADNTRMQLEMQHQQEMLQNLKSYAGQVDSISLGLRQFRHDHHNLMLGFKEYIDASSQSGLRNYYDKYMAEFTASKAVSDAIIKKLDKIQIPVLRSILLAKSAQAQQQGTTFWLEVSDIISINNDTVLLDLCRIAGILLDNAIEACAGVDGAELRVFASSTGRRLHFIFQNTCHTPPPMHLIFDKDFTTKSTEGGLGLYNVMQLTDQNPNFVLSTTAKDGVFSQELYVKN